MEEFEKELKKLINRHSLENDSNTPDFILARYLVNCLRSLNRLTGQRDDWYGDKKWVDEPLSVEEHQAILTASSNPNDPW